MTEKVAWYGSRQGGAHTHPVIPRASPGPGSQNQLPCRLVPECTGHPAWLEEAGSTGNRKLAPEAGKSPADHCRSLASSVMEHL